MKHMVSNSRCLFKCHADFHKGLLDHTWSGYRGNASLAALQDVIQVTYAAYGQ
jgi:hypothetical protein